MANKRRDAGKERFWRDVLKRQPASGLSVRGFCRRERVNESAFYAWRRAIAQRDAEEKRAGQTGSLGERPTFLPVILSGGDRHDEALMIELAGGRLLRLPTTIAASWLAELVQALEGRAAR